MANLTYNEGRHRIWSREIDLTSITMMKVSLHTATYVANKDDASMSACTNELTGTGYQAGWGGTGRKALASIVVSTDNANDWAKYTAANFSWTAINAGTAAALVLHAAITSDAASYPVVYIDGGFGPTATNGGDLAVNVGANGLWTWT